MHRRPSASRRNLIAGVELPDTTPTGLTYGGGDSTAALDRAADLIGFDDVRAEEADRRSRDDLTAVGIGFASYVSVVDASGEQGCVEVADDGTVAVRCGTFPHGRAHRTTIATVAAGVLGVAASTIDDADGD